MDLVAGRGRRFPRPSGDAARRYRRGWTFARDNRLGACRDGLARVETRTRFPGAVETFAASPNCRIVRIDRQLFHDALDLYKRAGDKLWGLVDCASFEVMRQADMMDAFTADRHFEQAGFRRLLAPPPR